jgi:hypothetical protein
MENWQEWLIWSQEDTLLVGGFLLIGVVIAFFTESLLEWAGEENDNWFRIYVIMGWPLFLWKLWKLHRRNS